MSDLKPCPFCGTQPKLPDGDGTEYEIWCEDCGGAVASVQICDLMTLEERASDSFKDFRYREGFVERAKLEAIDRWNTRAAPAEDVRAVGDEAVGYGAWNTGTNPGTRLMRYDGLVIIRPEKWKTFDVPVYLRPQRPVVLPERILGQQHGDKIAEAEQRGWNACLDEFKRLNSQKGEGE